MNIGQWTALRGAAAGPALTGHSRAPFVAQVELSQIAQSRLIKVSQKTFGGGGFLF